MSDSLSRLIRLGSRHNMPVIVHDSQSGESAVLMSLDEYENLAQCREECDMSEEESDEFLDELLTEKNRGSHDMGWSQTSDFEENESEESRTDFEEFPAFQAETSSVHEKRGKFSGSFEGKHNFPISDEPPLPEESASPWGDQDFGAFYDQKMKLAHDLHRDKMDIDWDKEPAEDFRYEPTRENGLFPAFNPEEEDDTGEEPIFFEEPV